jgi:riboflavin synthase
MFTGLIEDVGTLSQVVDGVESRAVTLQTAFAAELQPGDSVAVDGVCLTVTAVSEGSMRADLGPETLRVTTLGTAVTGARVNLERAMRGDSRFGGHFVQGHVDGVGRVERVWRDGDAHWVTVGYPSEAARYLIAKGAVAVDGISLTVAHLRDGQFDVMIVPFTWEHTNLPARRPGDRVNLEYDMVGKYVARAAELARQTRE